MVNRAEVTNRVSRPVPPKAQLVGQEHGTSTYPASVPSFLFHGFIASFAGRTAVLPELTRVKLHMDRFRQLMVAGVEDLPMVISQHEDIAAAVGAGDLPAAEERMRQHLRRIFSYVDEARARFPEYFEERAD